MGLCQKYIIQDGLTIAAAGGFIHQSALENDEIYITNLGIRFIKCVSEPESKE
ncbi:hypothetical protein NUACC21_03630 [Scytonema sp. NUACC21]